MCSLVGNVNRYARRIKKVFPEYESNVLLFSFCQRMWQRLDVASLVCSRSGCIPLYGSIFSLIDIFNLLSDTIQAPLHPPRRNLGMCRGRKQRNISAQNVSEIEHYWRCPFFFLVRPPIVPDDRPIHSECANVFETREVTLGYGLVSFQGPGCRYRRRP